jgi:hypothetical protein
MKDIYKQLIKVFTIRFYMIATRAFVLLVMLHSYSVNPTPYMLAATIISLPLLFVAFYRMVETLRLYVNISKDIDGIKKDLQHEKNKSYIKSL